MTTLRDSIPVALFGFGSQGRRIAHAISCQEDMKVVGIALNQPDLSAYLASKIGHKIYCTNPHDMNAFEKAGVSVEDSVESLLEKAMVVVDCAPSGVGKQNKERFYQKSDVKAIFQAGEDPATSDIPTFLSALDFGKARKARYVRIASPLAVSVARTLLPLAREFGVEEASCHMIRAGSETMRTQQGPVDSIVPEHPMTLERIRWEIRQMLGELNLSLSSVRVPSILLDVQSVLARLAERVQVEDALRTLTRDSRILVVSSEEGLSSTDSIFEFFRRARPSSGDVYEVCVWKEHVEVSDGKLLLTQTIDPHSVHIPEIIDAIRAMVTKISKGESKRLTDKALNILHGAV